MQALLAPRPTEQLQRLPYKRVVRARDGDRGRKTFLEHRIGDPNLLRIVRRFLKAGIMEDGAFTASDEGAPQGGLVSPVLSNIYLHYVLDLWFEKRLRGCARAKGVPDSLRRRLCGLLRARSGCTGLSHRDDRRLAQFDLEVEPSKTALLRFGSDPWADAGGDARTAHLQLPRLHPLRGPSRTGRFVVGRKTDGKRVRKKLKRS
jgi:RNA-directed DNA polymerase